MDCFPLGQVSASIQSVEADGEVTWGKHGSHGKWMCDGRHCLDRGLDMPFDNSVLNEEGFG